MDNIDKAVPGFFTGAIVTASFSATFPVVLIGSFVGALISYNMAHSDSDSK